MKKYFLTHEQIKLTIATVCERAYDIKCID